MLNEVIIFDIETGSLPLDQIRIPEFEAPANYTTEKAINSYKEKRREAFIKDAALSPDTGEVLLIGAKVIDIGYPTSETIIFGKDEKNEVKTLTEFWAFLNQYPKHSLIGWNSLNFDIPFLAKRSCKHHLQHVISNTHINTQIDLMYLWNFGARTSAFVGLEDASIFLGGAPKTEDAKKFKEIYDSDLPRAIKYLESDISITENIARQLEFRVNDKINELFKNGKFDI